MAEEEEAGAEVVSAFTLVEYEDALVEEVVALEVVAVLVIVVPWDAEE